MPELTDAEVIVASRSSSQAFVVVFERHFAAVHRYLRRRVPRDLADDLAAETFVRAFAGREGYRRDRPDARPWLYGIATNLLRHHFRREERELRAYARSGVDACGGGTPAELPDADLAGVLAGLNDGERDVLFPHVWAELSYEEIADTLAIPIGTVRSRLHRARLKLRELVEPEREYPHSRQVETEAGTTDG